MYPVQHNKDYLMKVLLNTSSFHLNGHTLWFHTPTRLKRLVTITLYSIINSTS